MNSSVEETKFVIAGAGWAGVRTAVGLVDSINETLLELKKILVECDPKIIKDVLYAYGSKGNFALNLAFLKEKKDLSKIIEIIDNFKVELWDANSRPFQGISGKFGIRVHSGLHYPNSEVTIKNCENSFAYFKNDKQFNALLVPTEAYYALTKADCKNNPPKVTSSKFSSLCDRLGAKEIAFDITEGDKKYYQSPGSTIRISQDNLQGLWSIDEPSVKLGEPVRRHIEQLLAAKQPRLICKYGYELREFLQDENCVNITYRNKADSENIKQYSCDYFINATSFQKFKPQESYVWKAIEEFESKESALQNNGFIYIKSKENDNKLYYRYQTGEIEKIEFKSSINFDHFKDLVSVVDLENAIKEYGGAMPADASPMFDAKYIYQPANCFVVRRKKTGQPPISFIVMDGLNPCIMPVCDDREDSDYEYYLLTHVAYTNLASCKTYLEAEGVLSSLTKSEVNDLYRRVVDDMCRYISDFRETFEFVETRQTILAKPQSKEEYRIGTVLGEGKRIIHVSPVKVTDIPDRQVKQLLAALVSEESKNDLIFHGNLVIIKDGVMHSGSHELGQRMTDQEKKVCSGHLDTLNELRQSSDNKSRGRSERKSSSSFSQTDSRKNSSSTQHSTPEEVSNRRLSVPPGLHDYRFFEQVTKKLLQNNIRKVSGLK